MMSINSISLTALSLASMAIGHPANLNSRDDALPSSLPASASYNYLVPALYLNLTVKAVLDLGQLATGGEQLLGDILDGHLCSEPGLEPQFSGAIRYAEDYLTSDPDGAYARPSCVMTVVPDNGVDKPFLMRITGRAEGGSRHGYHIRWEYEWTRGAVRVFVFSIEKMRANRMVVWTPFFFGGSANYSNLQDSIFVGSETASSSPIAGAFTVGMKFSKVYPVNTTITIGNEYP